MILEKITKQPVEVIDRDIDYATRFFASILQFNGTEDSIASVAITTELTSTAPSTSPMIATASIIAIDGAVNSGVKVVLTGGSNGDQYKVSITITCANAIGRIKQDELIVHIKDF